MKNDILSLFCVVCMKVSNLNTCMREFVCVCVFLGVCVHIFYAYINTRVMSTNASEILYRCRGANYRLWLQIEPAQKPWLIVHIGYSGLLTPFLHMDAQIITDPAKVINPADNSFDFVDMTRRVNQGSFCRIIFYSICST